jgi:hypothetical protein
VASIAKIPQKVYLFHKKRCPAPPSTDNPPHCAYVFPPHILPAAPITRGGHYKCTKLLLANLGRSTHTDKSADLQISAPVRMYYLGVNPNQPGHTSCWVDVWRRSPYILPVISSKGGTQRAQMLRCPHWAGGNILTALFSDLYYIPLPGPQRIALRRPGGQRRLHP